MSGYLSLADVTSRYDQTLPDSRLPWLQSLIDEAEVLLLQLQPDIPARVTRGELARAAVMLCLRRAVIRVLVNPRGLRYEVDGDYAYTRGDSGGSGDIAFTDEDLALLRPGGRAPSVGTIRLAPVVCGPWATG